MEPNGEPDGCTCNMYMCTCYMYMYNMYMYMLYMLYTDTRRSMPPLCVTTVVRLAERDASYPPLA